MRSEANEGEVNAAAVVTTKERRNTYEIEQMRGDHEADAYVH